MACKDFSWRRRLRQNANACFDSLRVCSVWLIRGPPPAWIWPPDWLLEGILPAWVDLDGRGVAQKTCSTHGFISKSPKCSWIVDRCHLKCHFCLFWSYILGMQQYRQFCSITAMVSMSLWLVFWAKSVIIFRYSNAILLFRQYPNTRVVTVLLFGCEKNYIWLISYRSSSRVNVPDAATCEGGPSDKVSGTADAPVSFKSDGWKHFPMSDHGQHWHGTRANAQLLLFQTSVVVK